MISRTTLCWLIAISLVLQADALQAAKPSATSYYLIGNSLTWDTNPGLLDGDVQWHVDCGTSLPYVHANPGKPCVKTSTLWPQALKEKQYDVVSVQPHYGATLQQDVEIISGWMKMQPGAIFIIHSGWAPHAKRVEEFATYDPAGKMLHSPAYYRQLLAQLRKLHPKRELRQTRAINVLAQVAQDIAAKKAPLKEMTDLHRDAIHMTHDHGKYLMHNVMRHALGQPPSAKGFEKANPKVKGYLDRVLALLEIQASDRKLLDQILSKSDKIDRQSLIKKISDTQLQGKLTEALPEIQEAAKLRRRSSVLQAEIEEIGGKIHFASSGPQWLYLVASDAAMDLFETPVAIDLYNGNNPLKGRGGKNEQVTDAWLEKLSGLTTLLKLDLANCLIQGEGLRHVGSLSNLQGLNLTLTPVTDESLVHLASLTELRSLGLASTECTGTGFEHLTALKKLESVNFHHTPLNNAGLQAISKVNISDRLWFAHTHFTDEGVECLASLKQLRRCGIGSKEPGSSGEAVATLAKLPLQDLALLDSQASSVGVAHAAKIKTLRRLDVSYGPKVDDAALKLVAQMPRLEEFKLGHAAVTDEGIAEFAKSKSLKKLTLSRLKNVSEAAIKSLQKAQPELVIEVK